MKRAAILLLFATSAMAQTLTSTIDSIIAAPDLQRAVWAIDVEDDAGTVLYQHNAHTLVMPASNRKIFAASTAIECLGADHRYATELWIDGNNLVIRGSGDPGLGGRWAFDREGVFSAFVSALRGRNITAVNDIVADVAAFDRVTIPGSWKAGNLGSYYAAPVDALAYNENVVGVRLYDCARPVVTTDPAFVSGTADVICVPMEDRLQPVEAVAQVNLMNGENAALVIGLVDKTFQGLPPVVSPGIYAAQALRDALRHAGIAVRGNLRLNVVPRQWGERVATIESQPLWQLLTVVLKNSQNLYAEMLYKSTGGSYARAQEIERGFLTNEVGIDAAEFRFVDGSGLSSDDLVTPAAIVRMFRWMNAPARRGLFWTILATPGEEGTLHRRLESLATRLRGKTGTIAGVNALSGIVAGKNGGYRYFSVVLNHSLAPGEKALDDIVSAVADF